MTARSRSSPPVATEAPASGCRGRHHGFRPHGRSVRSRSARGGRSGGCRGSEWRWRSEKVALDPPGRRSAVRHRDLPRRRAQGQQGRVADPAPTRSPAAQGSAITQVTASYGDSRRRILVANSDGLLAERRRRAHPVHGFVRRHRRHRHADRSRSRRPHGRVGAVRPVRRRGAGSTGCGPRITKLNARPAPSGEIPVVIGSGGGGVLFHEACGHGLEADLVGKGASVFKGRVESRLLARA